MTMVFAHSQAKATARVVALSLANNYDTTGDYAVTSMEALCRESAATPEQVERALRKLVALGEWKLVRSTQGAVVMRLVLACPLDCDRTPMHRTSWDLRVAS